MKRKNKHYSKDEDNIIKKNVRKYSFNLRESFRKSSLEIYGIEENWGAIRERYYYKRIEWAENGEALFATISNSEEGKDVVAINSKNYHPKGIRQYQYHEQKIGKGLKLKFLIIKPN